MSHVHTLHNKTVWLREDRHIVELSLATMFHAHIPIQYWTDVFESVTFVINRLPSAAIAFESPFQRLFKRLPDYQFFKILGCKCYPYTRPYSPHKLSPRSRACVFLGYSSVYKGYKCLDLSTNRIYVSRHVIFDETAFPFKDKQTSSQSSPSSTANYPLQLLSFNNFPAISSSDISSTSISIPSTSSPNCQTLNNSLSIPPKPPITHVYSRRSTTYPSTVPPSPLPQPSKSPPISSHQMITRAKSRLSVSTPKAMLATNHPISIQDLDPTSFTQASKEPHWRCAMTKKLDALAQNKTWSLVPASQASNVVGCKWVFKTKRNSNGSIERYKARLVAKGYTQEEGVDYTDTFSPVVKPTTIRLVLTLAVTSNWPIKQLDVNNAFLHGTLNEEIFMSQPPGFVDSQNPTHVCRLHKAIYGLRQSPRAWYQKLSDTLVHLGFHSSSSDPSLFLYQ
jgi:Reverse transcriptase (RNA-dependent DNA polymerase)